MIACHDREPERHVFSSPAPATTRGATAVANAPEVGFGTRGPGAQVVSVVDVATGGAVSLSHAPDSLDVLAMVAFGPDVSLAREGGRMELTLRAARDSLTQTVALVPPAPVVQAQRFHLRGLHSGRYEVQVLLRRASGAVLAQSLPLTLEIQPSP